VINKLVISGTIAQDPKAEKVGDNKTLLCSFPIAFESFGSKPEHTKVHWLYTKVWGKRAEFFSTLPEGTEVVAEGQLQEERWKDKQGDWQSRFVLNPGAIQVFNYNNGKED
jgi:single-stranded DNA-binding protein